MGFNFTQPSIGGGGAAPADNYKIFTVPRQLITPEEVQTITTDAGYKIMYAVAAFTYELMNTDPNSNTIDTDTTATFVAGTFDDADEGLETFGISANRYNDIYDMDINQGFGSDSATVTITSHATENRGYIVGIVLKKRE